MGIPRYLAVGVALGTLAACGGGGGGGGGGGSSSDTPLQYSGNTNAAAITTSNASTLAANVIGGDDIAAATAAISGGNEAQSGQGLIDVGRRLARTVRANAKPRSDARPTSVLIDQTDPCTNGGTVRIFGDVSQGGTGTVNVTYTNCNEGGDTLSGSATMRIDHVLDFLGDLIPTDFTITFVRAALRGANNIDFSGSLRVVTDVPTNSETITENVVALYNNTGRMTKSENLVFVDTYDNLDNPSSYTELVNGRVFDSVHGFVDILTSSELGFPNLTQAFPSGGELVLTGAANRRIRVTANSVTLVTLELDLNGDGVFERQARLRWTDLAGPVGADLGDNDSDGMHNSWETANGLLPNVWDATGDNDGDSFSNLSEYLGGGNPTNGSVIPMLTVGAPFPAASDIAVANSNMDVPGQSAIAFDGTNYLLVSCRELGPSPGVIGVLISPSGGVLSNFLIVSDTCPRNTAVAFDGTNYLVVLTPNGGQVRGIRVTPAGVVLDGAGFLISSPPFGTVNHRPVVAFDGANYLALWVNSVGGGRIFGARVTPAGSVLGEFPVSSGGSFETFPMVAFDGTNYLVIWTAGSSGSEDVSGAFVSPGGTASASFGIATLPNSQFAGGVAFDGTNYLVVWDHTANTSLFPPPDGQIFGRRLTPAGTLLDGAASTSGIPIATGSFRNHSSAVAFIGSTFLVTWAVGSFPNFPPAGIYAARVSMNGARVDGLPGEVGVPVSGTPTTSARFVHPVAASSGQSSLIAWVNNIEVSGKDILAAPILAP